ncbi:MAG: hypothetical protein LBE36_13325 [Flavobacteriaceae bacterium]|jgi:hypothetical protein|nr:hypothetical protein [Flavobacteriaceae bacterium]
MEKSIPYTALELAQEYKKQLDQKAKELSDMLEEFSGCGINFFPKIKEKETSSDFYFEIEIISNLAL